MESTDTATKTRDYSPVEVNYVCSGVYCEDETDHVSTFLWPFPRFYRLHDFLGSVSLIHKPI